MDVASRYYQIVRLAPTGQSKVVELAIAKQYFLQVFSETPQFEILRDTEIQQRLFDLSPSAPLAQLCLRCFISWQITKACQNLAAQFGTNHSFTVTDLLPLVLDDDGTLSTGTYQSLGKQILASYDPRRGSLAGWVHLRVKHHREINQFLNEAGVYLISDWALLNDTKPQQLERILRDFHHLSPVEIDRASQLLLGYHRVYRQARLQQRQRFGAEVQTNPRSRSFNRRCQPPTSQQLQQIGELLEITASPERVLSQLQILAKWVREYRLYIRSGLFPVRSLDAATATARSPLDQLASPATSETNSETEQFLEFYRDLLLDCLNNAIKLTLTQRINRLQRRKPDQSQQFLTGLQLFHCDNQSMSAIAPQLAFKAQYQVTRLLNLKALRADVRQQLLTELLQKVLEKAKDYRSRDRLQALEMRVEAALSEQIDTILESAQTEASTAKKFTNQSNLFAQQLCEILDRWIG
jgi:hypothetical protein